ncbi:hypothetical protein RHSIM_Rhsim05G0010300 [Rhododendron simsii]|uniref:PGG domain-containing protein n=1 Tax=Rhododendron simsii TaxID=118357 RepID=A0A834H199_RHOSS|nr:hypothetical protein RHSIM_Rhsim05G0010300 [Rhododendron simsii]
MDSSSDTLKKKAAAGTSSSINPAGNIERREEEKYKWSRYIPLVRATLTGDWKTAENFFQRDISTLTGRITEEMETALHIAVGVGKANIHFVEKLVERMPVEALAFKNNGGATALHLAAYVGNTKAAAILVDKHSPLLYIDAPGLAGGNDIMLPVHCAAVLGRRDTLSYLLDVTSDDRVAVNETSCTRFIDLLISSYFFDIALKWVEKYPRLPASPLETIAWKRSAFESGSQLSFWQRKIYPYVPVKLEKCSVKDQNKRDDVEMSIPQVTSSHVHEDNRAQSIGKNISIFVPQIKHIRKEKLRHVQALQLVKTLCEKLTHYDDGVAQKRVVRVAMARAIDKGIPEIIEEIVERFQSSIWTQNEKQRNLFLQAIINRHENVFNLIYQMSDFRYIATITADNEGNNMLHLAGRLAPANKLSLVAGAALQMQRELQWFEEVKKFLYPALIEARNNKRETPGMVFTREHRDLVDKGEKWMKDTANSCTITAVLIVTIVFAAAITVPGGNNSDTGLPVFSQKVAFIIFAVSDAFSLFTSTTSLLMFLLSILNSRCAERDFLHVLPKRLIIGLFTLFLSITAMMVAFSCTLYLVFGKNKAWMILIPVAALACLPITSFVTLQFPLLVDLISSTYGKGIFGKQGDKILY